MTDSKDKLGRECPECHELTYYFDHAPFCSVYPANRRYKIVRYHRDVDGAWNKTEVSGLTWQDASARVDRLTEAEAGAHPEKTSWTRDLMVIELERPAKKEEPKCQSEKL